MNTTIVWITLIGAVLILGLIFFLLYRYERAREGERIAMGQAEASRRTADTLADAIAEQEREIRRQVELAEKTEDIRHEQINQRDQVSTGDPDADFAGSLDVMRDIAAKRARDREGN